MMFLSLLTLTHTHTHSCLNRRSLKWNRPDETEPASCIRRESCQVCQLGRAEQQPTAERQIRDPGMLVLPVHFWDKLPSPECHRGAFAFTPKAKFDKTRKPH